MKRIYSLPLIVAALLISGSASAQSLKSILSKAESVVSAVTGSSTSSSMEGTWSYSGPAVEFESDNTLTSVTGVAAASTVESTLSTQLEKIGITEGSLTFTFASDSTFTATLSSKDVSGTYSYDTSAGQVKMTISKVNLTANVTLTSSTMNLTFAADKLLSLLSTISSKTSSSTLSTISSLASSYDGMNLGFELTKQ